MTNPLIDEAFLCVMNARNRELALPLSDWAGRNLLKRRIGVAVMSLVVTGRLSAPSLYLIWSNEHRAWWRANSAGYTTSLTEAGRYTRPEALDLCSFSRDGWGSRAMPSELPVAENDAIQCKLAFEQLMAERS